MSYPICPKCKRIMRVDTSKRIGQETQARYYECCGYSAYRELPRSLIRTRLPGKRVKKSS
jgi:hypothetical protein